MPMNLYYHFYSLEKMSSYRALDSVYKYLDSVKNDLTFIYPSEFIDSVNGFFDAKIFVDGKKYEITNCAKLNTLRFNGKVGLKNSVGVQSIFYDAKQNVTYISINANSVSFEVSD
jgi:hypothetical protein